MPSKKKKSTKKTQKSYGPIMIPLILQCTQLHFNKNHHYYSLFLCLLLHILFCRLLCLFLQ